MAARQWPSALCSIDPTHVASPQVIAAKLGDKFALFLSTIVASETHNHFGT